MVAIENSAVFAVRQNRSLGFLIVLGTVGAALLVAAVAFILSGAETNGARSAAELVMRFSAFVFVIAWVAEPLARLLPFKAVKVLGDEQPALALAFMAVYAMFLGCVALPYFLTGVATPLPTMVFCAFSAGILGVMFLSRRDDFGRFMGRGKRAMQSLSWGFFWVVFTAGALERMVGPHRPDAYYGLIVDLLVAALLVRFADAFLHGHKSRMAEKVG
jgi:peptidoglycan/LPS O-acetylase OafA/YrhL